MASNGDHSSCTPACSLTCAQRLRCCQRLLALLLWLWLLPRLAPVPPAEGRLPLLLLWCDEWWWWLLLWRE